LEYFFSTYSLRWHSARIGQPFLELAEDETDGPGNRHAYGVNNHNVARGGLPDNGRIIRNLLLGANHLQDYLFFKEYTGGG
jgi:hypothetical protein